MIINPKTKLLLEAFINRPSSSVIVAGSMAGGAEQVVQKLVTNLLDESSRHNIVQLFPEEGKGIGVEQSRNFKKSLTSLVKSKSDIARIAIIWSADLATPEAQNAFLKLIEEPTKQTLLILHVTNSEKLLPTITSRCQVVPVLPITKIQATEYGESKNILATDIQKALLITSGQSKLFEEYLNKGSEIIDETIIQAKQFITEPVFSRLIKSKQYEKSDNIYTLLENIEKLSSSGLHASKNDKVNRWVNILKEIKDCRNKLERNVSPKLIYLRLCISI